MNCITELEIMWSFEDNHKIIYADFLVQTYVVNL